MYILNIIFEKQGAIYDLMRRLVLSILHRFFFFKLPNIIICMPYNNNNFQFNAAYDDYLTDNYTNLK